MGNKAGGKTGGSGKEEQANGTSNGGTCKGGSGEGYSRSAVRSCVDGLILNARIKYVEGTVSGCYCNARDSAKTLHQCQGLVLSPLKLLQYQ